MATIFALYYQLNELKYFPHQLQSNYSWHFLLVPVDGVIPTEILNQQARSLDFFDLKLQVLVQR